MLPPQLAVDASGGAVSPGTTAFRVVGAGVYAGRWWRVGERIVCGGRPLTEDQVVLVPVGRGQPRFGRIRRLVIEGDQGDACDPARWRPVGRVLHTLPAEPEALRHTAGTQLSLFGAVPA